MAKKDEYQVGTINRQGNLHGTGHSEITNKREAMKEFNGWKKHLASGKHVTRELILYFLPSGSWKKRQRIAEYTVN